MGVLGILVERLERQGCPLNALSTTLRMGTLAVPA